MRDSFEQEDRGLWVFWVHASTRSRVEEDFKWIADIVDIPGRNQPNTNIFQLVHQWLQDERASWWLMVLDSADDMNVFYDTGDKEKRQVTVRGKKDRCGHISHKARTDRFLLRQEAKS